MRKINSADLSSGWLGSDTGLISCLSFEKRSLSAARAFAACGLKRWVCFENQDIETNIDSIRHEAQAIANSAGTELELLYTSKKDPLKLADAMVDLMHRTQGSNLKWVVDVSTMTHEMVLVLVAAIDELQPNWIGLTIIYNAARQYSDNENEKEKRWISRGIHGLRSVIGYSGLWEPGETAVLVALPGFDLERVQRIVEELEPEVVLVGVAKPAMKQHAWMYERNKAVATHVLSSRRGRIFEYESLTTLDVVRAISTEVRGLTCNLLVAPLNTKITTLTVGMLARLNPKWQVCYAPALVYNLHYSSPSDVFFCFEYDVVRHEIMLLQAELSPIEQTLNLATA